MTKQDTYGAAVHEAGHVVVAWALGHQTRRMAVGVSGHDDADAAEIEGIMHLPLVDQIAICSAGVDAQCMLNAPIHDIAALSDMVKIGNLIEDHAEEEGEALLHAGYRRSKEILEMHRKKVERLAQALAEQIELHQVVIEKILNG
ncbi:MAG: hypothetical protein ACXWKP_27995 [Bradyrhizobium sp.]